MSITKLNIIAKYSFPKQKRASDIGEQKKQKETQLTYRFRLR